MKEIQLTQGKVALVDDADFDWLNQHKWFAQKVLHTWYAARKVGISPHQNNQVMHNVIMGAASGIQVDHRDWNGLNNQRHNLRLATTAQNIASRRKPRNNKSGYKGVSWDSARHKWIASIGINHRDIRLGRFDGLLEAARAYDAAARKFHGEFAVLNFPDK